MSSAVVTAPRPRTLGRRVQVPAWIAPAIPLALTVLACALYVALDLRPVDLAASVFRAHLFGNHGMTLWDGYWYGGHYTLSYSVLSPALAWLFGSVPLEIACALASTLLFQALAVRHFGRPALAGAAWFGLSAAFLVFHGQVPFGLGVTFGLAALLAFQRERLWLANALAVATALSSPVAALFLALAGVSYALVSRRAAGVVIAVCAMLPTGLLQVAFPEGGHQPYRPSELAWLLASVLITLVLLPARERVLRLGALLYGLGGTAAYVLHTPLGNNVGRLAPLVAGPLIVCALSRERPRGRQLAAALLVCVLAWFQVKPTVDDVTKVRTDPAAQAEYYRPLIEELKRFHGQPPFRVEVPFTRVHWETAEIGSRYPMARGWERQLDVPLHGIFYGGVLTKTTYGAWLAEHGVRLVAVASGRPDSSAYKERALIESGLPYLKLIWRSENWRLYEVTLPHALVIPEGSAEMRLTKLGADYFKVDVARPGAAEVKVRWSQYWRAEGGCVERDGQWTRLIAHRPGPIRVAIDFSLGRVFTHGRRC